MTWGRSQVIDRFAQNYVLTELFILKGACVVYLGVTCYSGYYRILYSRSRYHAVSYLLGFFIKYFRLGFIFLSGIFLFRSFSLGLVYDFTNFVDQDLKRARQSSCVKSDFVLHLLSGD